MRATDLSVLDLTEVRRRSILVWRSIPDSWLTWKPDDTAMSMGEMIRHIWTSQVYYHEAVKYGGSMPNYADPYDQHPITSVEEEASLSQPYFERFLDYVRGLSDDNLGTRMIDRSNVGYVRSVGDMLARIAYHESVHTGQLLQYMRMAGLERPQIWD